MEPLVIGLSDPGDPAWTEVTSVDEIEPHARAGRTVAVTPSALVPGADGEAGEIAAACVAAIRFGSSSSYQPTAPSGSSKSCGRTSRGTRPGENGGTPSGRCSAASCAVCRYQSSTRRKAASWSSSSRARSAA